MKRLTIALTIVALLVTVNCSKKKVRKPQAPDYTTEGWLDSDTFQVIAKGKPIESARGFMRRRRFAKKDATIMAHRRVVELMAKDLGSTDAEKKVNEKFAATIESKGAFVTEVGVGKFTLNDAYEGPFRVKEDGLQAKVYALT